MFLYYLMFRANTGGRPYKKMSDGIQRFHRTHIKIWGLPDVRQPP